MNNFKYDITMKSHEKDYYKMPLTINSLKYLNPQPERIYIITPDGFAPKDNDYQNIIIPIKDEDAIPKIDKGQLRYRPNWVWANIMSFTQDITENDFYLDVQADTFFLKEINLLSDDGRPKLFKTQSNPNNNYNQDHSFFKFSKAMFGIEKITLGESYIIDYTMYNKTIGKEICSSIGTVDEMIKLLYLIVDDAHFPADGEIFGNYIEKNHENMYNISREINHVLTGHEGAEPSIHAVEQWINACRSNPELHSCTYHNWI